MTYPVAVKVTPVTPLECSVKVMKQKPLRVFHTLTCGGTGTGGHSHLVRTLVRGPEQVVVGDGAEGEGHLLMQKG